MSSSLEVWFRLPGLTWRVSRTARDALVMKTANKGRRKKRKFLGHGKLIWLGWITDASSDGEKGIGHLFIQ